MVQTLSTIRQLLAARGLRPKHRLGQNFLHDAHHLDRIVQAAELTGPALPPSSGQADPANSAAPRDTHPRVLEIGPGTGVLSERLLEAGAELIAVEVDGDLIPILEERLAPWADRLRLIQADILRNKNQLEPSIAAMLNEAPFRLVANLPYQVASPLLVSLARDFPTCILGVAMVQDEVARRLTAQAGEDEYGPLSLMVQAWFRVERVAELSPDCFWPRPEVRSAVVKLMRLDRPRCSDAAQFESMVRLLFQSRRKQIGGILRRHGLKTVELDPTLRPEELTLEQIDGLAMGRN
ncbi:MAG: ribosomal RNA small subunit methyltransferase A [Phycisphaeraceae bacterium]|nr:ribosomal RNA small subunit methyltransferase A [Phycisphaeraceae bacterium]